MRFIKFQSHVERCGTHYARANSRNSASWYSPLARAPSQTSARFACSFLYPFQRLRERKLNGVVLTTLVPIQETRHKAWYFAIAHTTAQTSARLACSFLFQRFFEIFFNPLVKIKLLSYNTYATEKNNSTKRISRQVGIR